MKRLPRLLVPFLLAAAALLALSSLQTRAARSRDLPALPEAVTASTFFDSGQTLGGGSATRGVAVGDLDGDGDPDAFAANDGANQVWLNQGFARFNDNGQQLGSMLSQGVALGDLDGDADLDAVVANRDGLNRVWLNHGNGNFSPGQTFDAGFSLSVALGDLDGDLDLDVFVANSDAGGNTIWINNGGVLTDSLQTPGNYSYDVALDDLDGDSDLDAFLTRGLSGALPDQVWINQGGAQAGTPGVFADSGQSLGNSWGYGVAVGDLDGMNGPDAFVANWFPNANTVWLNDGTGTYNASGQMLGTAGSLDVGLGDLDGDTDLDAFVVNNTPAGNRVWINDGAGQFTDSGQSLDPTNTSEDVALADLDADGDLDAFIGTFSGGRVYLNGDSGLPAAFFDVDSEANDGGDQVYYSTSSSDAVLPILLTYPYTAALEVHARIEAPGETFTETFAYTIGQQVRFLNILNPMPNPNVAVTLTLSVTPPATPPLSPDVTDQLVLVFVDANQGLSACILCYLEWLGRFMGFDPAFGALHHMNLPDQEASPLWPYYTGFFDFYAPEMAGIVATHPSLLWDSLKTFDEWTPAVASLEAGTGSTITVTQVMVDDAIDLLEGVQAEAGPGLAAALQHEMDAADLPSLAGLSVDEVWTTLEDRRPIEDTFITIILR